MKKQMMNSVRSTVSSFLVGLLTLVLCTAMVPRAHSQESEDSTKPLVSYLGRVQGQPVLLIEFDNKEAKPYSISIKDPQGVVLYSSDFRDKKFVKRFQVAQDEPGDMKLTVTFSSGKLKETQVVEINTTSYVKEDFLVTRQ
jgi:hypothetical protein